MKVRKNVILFSSIMTVIFILMFFIFNSSFENGQISFLNRFTLIMSLFLVMIGLNSMTKKGINTYNAFLCTFYIFLAINTFNISSLQTKKSIEDVYYYFVGSLMFVLLLYWGENKVLKNGKIKSNLAFLSPECVVIILLAFYYFLFGYIFIKTGIRLFSGNYLSTGTSAFVLPGISGLVYLLMWILLMYVPHVSVKLQLLIYVSTVVLSGICMVKRGDIMRITLFFILYYVYRLRNKIFSRKVLTRLVFLAFIFLLGFISLGNIRSMLRNGGEGSISDGSKINSFLESNIDVGNLAWIYSYSAINFDVLKLYTSQEPEYSLRTIFLPITRIVDGSQGVVDYDTRVTVEQSKGLHGFNAATFMSNFITDLGLFYFIEIFILGIIIGLIIMFSKSNELIGIYVFNLMNVVMAVFGNYFTNPNYVFAMIGAAVALTFTRRKVECNGLKSSQ